MTATKLLQVKTENWYSCSMSTTLLQILEKLSNIHPLSLLPFLLFTILLYQWHYKNPASFRNVPPSPPKLPILGNLHRLSKSLHRSLHSLSQRYGDPMLLHIGSKPTLVVSSADSAREIMKTHDVIFSNRPKSSVARIILYDGKDIAFANYGEYWRQMKSICVLQMFSNKKVRSFRRVREEEAALMVEKIKSSTPSEEVNLSEIIVRLTNDVICRAAFGRKYTGEKGGSNIRELLNDFSEALGVFNIGDFIPWLGWIDWMIGLEDKAKRVAQVLDEFVEKILQEHMDREKTHTDDDGDTAKGEEVQDFVDILLETQKENTSALSRDSIKALLLNMLAAGTDTTYTLLEWAMTELLMHPRAMKELQEEVRRNVRGKLGVSEDDLENMKYLKAVIKETLRLHPSLPLLLFRESSQDVKIKGYNIASRTQVIINAWAIHRDPAYWEEPEKFLPERFLNSSADFKGQDFNFIPFGAGRRGCPATSFAAVNAELVLANLVCEFDWKLPSRAEGESFNVAESNGTTIRRQDPLLAIPTPYSLS